MVRSNRGYGEESSPPQIAGIEPIVMRSKYELPWERQSNQTACGATIQNQVGHKGWKITIEGILTLNQLHSLTQKRDESYVEVVTEELGSINVAFDKLNVERLDEEEEINVGDYTGPMVKFQLQTKEDEQEPLFDNTGWRED